ncbi:MAG: NAD(P)-dependent oxidoreductase [Dehalococcoidia bacterium]
MGKQRPILVTGGAGFLGAYIARDLAAKGHRVVTVDVREPDEAIRYVLREHTQQIEPRLARVDDRDAMEQMLREVEPTEVVHVAAIVDPPRLARDPHLALDINLRGTVNLLAASNDVGVRRFVYFSSIGVLPTIQYEPIDVDHPVVLASEGPGAGAYGASKLASEAFCHAAVTGWGLDCRIVRPSAVYGLGMQWPIFIKPMVEGAVDGRAVHFEHGGPFPRDYTHVEDVASLTLALLNAPDPTDRVFYAATGEPLTTTSQLATIIERLLPGSSITVGNDLSDDDRLELPYRGVLSIDNARNQLGWTPRYPIEAGIAAYIEQYRAFVAANVSPQAGQ